MKLLITAILLLFTSVAAWGQAPISHQNWQSVTVISDAIAIDCASLLLPFELGQLLVENNPTTERGQMDKSLRSPHAVKVALQPETGTSDQITNITGCTTNGARLQLATVDTGDSITVVHTPGVIEFDGGGSVTLSSPRQILTLQRKAGIWVVEGGFGGGGGGGLIEDMATLCPRDQYPISDGAGQVYCSSSVFITTDCSAYTDPWLVCLDWDYGDGGALYIGNGTEAVRANPIYFSADCSDAQEIGEICVDTDDGNIYRGNGEESTLLGGGSSGGTQSLDQTFNVGKIITGANSEVNAFVVGDGTNGLKFFVGSGGPTIKCFQGGATCDITFDIPTGNSFRLKYNGTEGIVVSSSGVVTLNNAMIENKSYWFGAGVISVDGTNCTAATERIINSGPKTWMLQCADNDASVIYGSVVMPDAYSGGLVTFELNAFSEAAPPSGVLNFDFASMCRSDSDVINNTWPTGGDLREVALTLDTQNDREEATSSAQAPNGGCAAGDMLFWKATMDATSTTTQVANTYILGVKMEYPTNKWSD